MEPFSVGAILCIQVKKPLKSSARAEQAGAGPRKLHVTDGEVQWPVPMWDLQVLTRLGSHTDTLGKSISERLCCASTGAMNSCIPEVSGLWNTHFHPDEITADSQLGSTLLKWTINLIEMANERASAAAQTAVMGGGESCRKVTGPCKPAQAGEVDSNWWQVSCSSHFSKATKNLPRSSRWQPLCSTQPLPSASCQALLTRLILQPAQRRSFVRGPQITIQADLSPARASKHRLQLHTSQKGP